jgi:UDP-glucose 4-epimerase
LHYFITGGCGFVGSNMGNFLLSLGHQVTVFDNFSSGFKRFLNNNLKLKIIKGDLLDTKCLMESLTEEIDFVYHFSANADVRFGFQNPKKDLEQNTIATFNLLETMRIRGIKRIGFSSTGSVYGEANIYPTPEDAPFPIQTSLYGASKIACEGLISSYCEGFEFKAYIYRFVSLLGEHYTHGHVFDFTKSLLENSSKLKVLGDGNQKKSYLNIKDCVKAMHLTEKKNINKVDIYNIGNLEYITVKDSIKYITQQMNKCPEIFYQGGIRGWIGDSPRIQLDNKKIKLLGWIPQFSIEESVKETVIWLLRNKWVFDKR